MMSIWNSIVRYIDPLVSRRPRRPLRRSDTAVDAAAGDDIVSSPSWQAERPLVCRVCGYRSGPEHRYCLRCLTETMERAP
jgi:hypothetical protein